LDGGHEVNEIWFEDVRVPLQNRVGDENKGWTYAKFLLGHERTNIAGIGGAKRELARLKRIAASERKNGRPLIEDPLFAANIAQVEIDLWALEITNLRVLSGARSRAPGPEASILKIRGTEIAQRISELLMRAVGPYALPFRREAMEAGWQADPAREAPGPRYASTLAAAYMNQRKLSIFGGTNEIQKNIISKMIVGL
jgi:alkylation response protein AidB-like acyl-CoA dehydrogenase